MNVPIKPYWEGVKEEAQAALDKAKEERARLTREMMIQQSRVAKAEAEIKKQDPLNVKTIASGSVLRMHDVPEQGLKRGVCTVVTMMCGGRFAYKLVWDGDPMDGHRKEITGHWETEEELREFFKEKQDHYTRIS